VAEEAAVVIRPGRVDEGERLKQIAIDSKGFWGYEPERVREWADRGDFSPQRLAQLTLFVAEADGCAIGWASLIPGDETAWLEDLWIEPGWIGKGIGRRLFRQAADHARSGGATGMEWEAEPNALAFYEKMGGRRVRDSTSEWGRTLSVMRVDLDA
jgi:GNAT superfamily N-acetyltransferase